MMSNGQYEHIGVGMPNSERSLLASSGNAPIQFKVNLADDTRVILSQEVSYSVFQSEVQMRFGHGPLVLSYQDSEGDQVTIDSQQSLEAAVEEFRGHKSVKIKASLPGHGSAGGRSSVEMARPGRFSIDRSRVGGSGRPSVDDGRRSIDMVRNSIDQMRSGISAEKRSVDHSSHGMNLPGSRRSRNRGRDSDGEEEEDLALTVVKKETSTPAPTVKKEAAMELKMEDEHDEKVEFVPSTGLTTVEAEALLVQFGKNELAEKRTPKWLVYLQQLKGPMPIMIWLAIIIEAAIQNWIDFGILLGIQFINATIGWYETTKAGDAVAALKKSLRPVATCKRDGVWANLDATIIVPGDLVLLAAGSSVPADCIVNHGRIEVDQAALTGESLPVTMTKGDSPKMGSNITRGEVEATVAFTGKNTFFGKTAAMLQGGNELGNLQKILLRIMVVLVTLSVTLCVIALIYLCVAKKERFVDSLQFVIVLLVASIPIAIEIVTTTTLAVGSRKLASMDAIVTRLVSIEEMAGMDMLCSDKTGTLTLNKMVIQEECPTYTPGFNRDSVLQMAALAAKWKEPARDALDTMVLGSANLEACNVYEQLDYTPFDPSIKRTEGVLKGPDGQVFKITKGAPNILLNLCANKEEIRESIEGEILQLGKRGIRCLGVARQFVVDGEAQDWVMLGILTFLDPPRPDTKRTIERAIKFGVDVKMITGDHQVIAVETARVLGINTNIQTAHGLPEMQPGGKIPKDLGKKYGDMILGAGGFAHVFPEHKFLIVEALRQLGYKVGMTGDGVNDAPALKRADVGIAVSGATDTARAASDIVITSPGLSVVVEAIIIARCIFQRVKNFINYRVAATLQLLCFFFITVFAFPPDHYRADWPVFFQLPVLLLMLITLLNDGTLITIGYDSVRASNRPEKWNLPVLFLVSVLLAGVAMASSLLLVWAALDSGNPTGAFAKFGLPPMEYGQVVMAIYMKVSISDFLTLFSARTQGFFFTQRPGWLLLGGGLFALSISTLLGCVWPIGELDRTQVWGLARTGPGQNYTLYPLWVWIYCLIWWAIQDTLKVLLYSAIYRFELFGEKKSTAINRSVESDLKKKGGKAEVAFAHV